MPALVLGLIVAVALGIDVFHASLVEYLLTLAIIIVIGLIWDIAVDRMSRRRSTTPRPRA